MNERKRNTAGNDEGDQDGKGGGERRWREKVKKAIT